MYCAVSLYLCNSTYMYVQHKVLVNSLVKLAQEKGVVRPGYTFMIMAGIHHDSPPCDL